MDLVSVVIPTYNRFKYLLNLIASVKAQTYPNIEIIVVNDCSTEKEYYEHDWDGVTIIHLKTNSKSIFGYVSCGYVRNHGIVRAQGKYVAFCDDDDIWFPTKIELQVRRMKETGCKMSATDGLFGQGVYNSHKIYPIYNAEYYYSCLQNIYKTKGSSLLDSRFPSIWDVNFLKIHNCIIGSSVILEKDILDKINNFAPIRSGEEDWDCWLRALEHTNCAYVRDICFYYDSGHGYGINN